VTERATRSLPWRALLRFLLLPALLAAVFAAVRWTPLGGYLSISTLTATIGQLRQSWWAPAVLVAGFVVLSPVVPATPLMVAGAVVFGGAAGSFYNCLGLLLGGMVSYYLGRLLGRDLVRRVPARRLRQVERAISQRGFWGLVAVRLLPLPFPLVNTCAAMAGVPPARFLTTTALGIIPPVTAYSIAFAALAHAGSGERTATVVKLVLAFSLIAVVTLVPQILQGRRRRTRLEELRARRAARRPGERSCHRRAHLNE
jgi:uncharacterized membrane protein YdjX (TVP38/TMEM64 family)